MSFSSDALKAKREQIGLTQSQMGQVLGFSGGAIYQWEGGRRHPEGGNLAKVEVFLEADIQSAKAAIKALDSIQHPHPASAFDYFLRGHANYVEMAIERPLPELAGEAPLNFGLSKKRGGAREGAGRKPTGVTPLLSVRLNDDDRAVVNSKGGSEYIRRLIRADKERAIDADETSLPYKATLPPSKSQPLRSSFSKLEAMRNLVAQGMAMALEMESDDARQLGRLIAQMQKQLLSAMDELDGVLKGD